MRKRFKILIGQLASNGDILYATSIARQIKEHDYPGCHLTWAVSPKCAATLYHNPYVDELWEVPVENNDMNLTWEQFCKKANAKKKEGFFDEIFLIQLIGKNLLGYNKTIRQSILSSYPKKITVSLDPVIQLTEEEVNNVGFYSEINRLKEYSKVALFECSPLSGQSGVTPEFAVKVAEMVSKEFNNVCFILSSSIKTDSNMGNIIDASDLTFRENAELSKYCDLLIGCSSGITWLLTSNWAKPLPAIQLLNSKAVWFNSVVKDYETRNQNADHVIELYKFDEKSAANCILDALRSGIVTARNGYHQQYNRYWCTTETSILFSQLKRIRILSCIKFSWTTLVNNNPLFLILVWKNTLVKGLKSFTGSHKK